MNPPSLALFTKSPIPGKVKTRFLTHTSSETAAAIALQMIEDTVSQAAASWRGPISLHVSPDTSHPELRAIAVRYNVVLCTQSPGDLGQKMQFAICQGLESSSAVTILGCDIPTISEDVLEYAFESLVKGSNIIGPSADGGFYMIGMQKCVPGLFEKITWSTDTVFEAVMAQSDELGTRFDVMLPCLNDIDSWKDFEHLTQIDPKYRKFL